MKKLMILLVTCCLATTGCGSQGVSQEEYSNLAEQKSQLESQNKELDNRLKELQSEEEQLSKEYAEYKQTMKEYEGLQAAEAEARKIEADKIIEQQKAEEESKAKEEATKKEQEEKLGYETGITYEQLARTPDDFKGKKIKFTGEVVQVVEGDDFVHIRLAVDSNYDTILYCEYKSDIVTSRILENDTITIYGTSYGLYSYESTTGATITIPSAVVDKIEMNVSSELGVYDGNETDLTMGQSNALKKALSYLKHSSFSYQGLIEQLEYEGYVHDDAVFAVDNCGADWNEQAAKTAASYLSHSAFSKDGLIEQLEFEGFTHEQAVYGAEQNGY